MHKDYVKTTKKFIINMSMFLIFLKSKFLNQNKMRWTRNATQVLIEERRSRQLQFTTVPIQRQYRIWRAISAEVLRRTGLTVTKYQCRNKWNALKKGYENLERLLEQNPRQFPTHTPNLDDEYFHEELSDEFWLVECNYFIIIILII